MARRRKPPVPFERRDPEFIRLESGEWADDPPLPGAWIGERARLQAVSHASAPEYALTALVVDRPGRAHPVVVADAMELASWEQGAATHAQAVLCPDEECGIESCLPGSWITLRAVTDELDGGDYVELGTSRERDPDDEWAFREHRPPQWLVDLGPCRIARADWDQLAHQYAGQRNLGGGAFQVGLPSYAQVVRREPAFD